MTPQSCGGTGSVELSRDRTQPENVHKMDSAGCQNSKMHTCYPVREHRNRGFVGGVPTRSTFTIDETTCHQSFAVDARQPSCGVYDSEYADVGFQDRGAFAIVRLLWLQSVFLFAWVTLGWAAGAAQLTITSDDEAQGYAQLVREAAPDIQQEIYEQLGLEVAAETFIFIGRDAESMLQRARKDHGSTPPEWAAGLAYPQKRMIYLHAAVPVDEFRVTLAHELSHVAFGQITARQRAPRWFVEGLAVWQSESFDLERAWLLTEAATMGRLLPLSELDRGFPLNGARAGVAYAQAVHFVGYLRNRFGMERFGRFIAVLRGGHDPFPDAVFHTFDVHLGQLERDWRSAIQVRWGWLGVLFGESSLWGIAAILLILGWFRRTRQRRERLAELRELEKQTAPEELEPRPMLNGEGSERDPNT